MHRSQRTINRPDHYPRQYAGASHSHPLLPVREIAGTSACRSLHRSHFAQYLFDAVFSLEAHRTNTSFRTALNSPAIIRHTYTPLATCRPVSSVLSSADTIKTHSHLHRGLSPPSTFVSLYHTADDNGLLLDGGKVLHLRPVSSAKTRGHL